MKKIILIFSIIVLMTGFVEGQTKSDFSYKPSAYYSLSWNNTFTLGNFNKWVGNTSPAGAVFGARYILMDNVTLGFDIGWQRISQSYGYQTFYGDNGSAVTATNYRFTWMIPFQVVIGYHLMPAKMISPYISLGIGGDYMEHHLLVQEYDFSTDVWDFSLTPEIGALIKFGNFSRWGALVAFNYKWTTNEIDYYTNRSLTNLQMLDLKVGLTYLIR
jgi:outer membrane protein W